MKYRIVLLCAVSVLSAWIGSRTFGTQRAVIAAPMPQSKDNDLTGTVTSGRFQIFNGYYSTGQLPAGVSPSFEPKGTGMVDSSTGRVWLLMAVFKDGKPTGEHVMFEIKKLVTTE